MMFGLFFPMVLLASINIAQCQLPDQPVYPIEHVALSVWEAEILEWQHYLDTRPPFIINSAWLNLWHVDARQVPLLQFYTRNDQCYGCPLDDQGPMIPQNGTITNIQTSFGNYMEIGARNDVDSNFTVCRDHVGRLKEGGDYWMIVFQDVNPPGHYKCNLVLANDPTNYNLHVLYAFLVFFGLAIIWIVGKLVYRRKKSSRQHDFSSTMTLELSNWTLDKSVIMNGNAGPTISTVLDDTPKEKTRLKSLDAFRGLSLIVMIFVNYGGGGYYYFEHAQWDGLFVADLVYPWFVWMMGVSIAFAFRGRLKKNIPKWRIFLKILDRTLKIFFIGLCLNAPNTQDMQTIRILGVLQRLALSYFFTASIHLMFVQKTADSPKYACGGCCGPLSDILDFWPEWIVMLGILGLQLCLTYLLPVPGCPTGYVGPGGLHKGGDFFNCTGGAAQYIDRLILTTDHMYQWPTIKELYKTTMPYDPEGILGILTTIFTCYLGLQAGKIITYYKGHVGRVVRWILWAVLTGTIGTVLCKASQFEGWIPINKNLWSVSFVLVLSSMAFIMLTFLYLIIDVAHIWDGSPFIYPGMNSIVIYVCHSVFGSYFPLTWLWPDYEQHWQRLFRALWGSVIWTFTAYVMYLKKVFIAL